MSNPLNSATDGTGVTIPQNDPTYPRYRVRKSVSRKPKCDEGQLWMACMLEAAKVQHQLLFSQSYKSVMNCLDISEPDERGTFYDRVAEIPLSLLDILLLELQARDAAWASREIAAYQAANGDIGFDERLKYLSYAGRTEWRLEAVWNLIFERALDVIDNDTPDMLARSVLSEQPGLGWELLRCRAEAEADAISDAIENVQAERSVVRDASRDETVSAARRL